MSTSVGPVRFSRGRSITDNHPRQSEVANFAAFVKRMELDRAREKKGAGYFCGPLNGDGIRAAVNVLPRRWVAVDLDQIEASRLIDLRLWFTRFSAVSWPTHSSKPEAPRERVIIELDRDATRDEGIAIGRALNACLGATFGIAGECDPTTFRGEQPVYLAPTNVLFAHFDGDPLDVDHYVAQAAQLPPEPVQTQEATAGDALVQIKAGTALHETIGRLIAQWAGKGMARPVVHAAAAGLLEHARKARGDERIDELLGDELDRLIAGAFHKYAPPATPEQEAQRSDPRPAPADEANGPPVTLPFLSLTELQEQSRATRWLVKHVIPNDALGLVFGGSGTFKSFIALDLAMHVAHGLRWLGRKTQQGAVIIIAAEGGSGLWRRIQAWHLEQGLDWRNASVHVVPISVNLATEASRVCDAAATAGVTPTLVIVDTLSQTFDGEENNAADVAHYLREIGLWFRAAWLCAVLVVHHTGHQATERPRGSSALRTNVDFMFGVSRDEKEMLATVECTKQKDGEACAPVSFALSVQELDTDEDGEPVTSLVARHVSAQDDVLSLMRKEALRGRGGRNHLFLELADNGIEEKKLRQVFYDHLDSTDPEVRKKAYYRARAWAVSTGLIEIAEGFVIRLETEPESSVDG